MLQIPLLLACIAGLLVAAVPAHAAGAGDLDPWFRDGKQTTGFGGGSGFGAGVAVQRDHKVVVAAQAASMTSGVVTAMNSNSPLSAGTSSGRRRGRP